MASISIAKQKRELNFGETFFKWLKDQDVEIRLETERALRKFSSEIEISKSIEESSNFITDSGPHRKASDLIEEFIGLLILPD
jgi:hypothetical protein